jgi:modulator of FtsH protease
MSDNSNVMFGRASTAIAQNRVLRNTYMLLAVTLVPTVFGAWLGMALKLPIPTGFVGALLMLGVMMGFIFAIEKTKNSSAGVFVLLAFTFFMGLMLSRMVGMVLGFKNGAQLIGMAMGGTALVFAGMSVLAATIKRDLSFMGKFLFIGMIMVLVAGLANFYFQSSALMIGLMVVSLGIFSAYLLYDLNNIIKGGETNYISATMNVYISLFAIFQNLLGLLGIFGGDRD